MCLSRCNPSFRLANNKKNKHIVFGIYSTLCRHSSQLIYIYVAMVRSSHIWKWIQNHTYSNRSLWFWIFINVRQTIHSNNNKTSNIIKVLLIILSEIKTLNLHVHTNSNGLLSFLFSFQSFNRNEKHSFSVSNGCRTSVQC